jgi:metal-responsive CopG/Arc/MetJ family transcriptional regulator
MNTLLITLDEETKKQVDALTRAAGKPEKEVIRDVVKAGLKAYQSIPSRSAQAILDLIEWAEKNQIRSSVTDLSTNHNKYAWEEK